MLRAKNLLPASPTGPPVVGSSGNGCLMLAYPSHDAVAVVCGESLRGICTLNFKSAVSAIQWSPSGNEIAVSTSTRVTICDLSDAYSSDIAKTSLASNWQIGAFDTPSRTATISWSPCGEYILCGGHELSIWQSRAAKYDWSLVWTSRDVKSAVTEASFCPKGRLFFTTCCADSAVRVWFHGGTSMFDSISLQHPGHVLAAAWKQQAAINHESSKNESSSVLVSRSTDNIIRIWVETPRTDEFGFSLVATIDASNVHAACWIQNRLPAQGYTSKSLLMGGHGHTVSQSWEMSHWGPYPRRGEQSDWLLGVTDEELMLWRIQGLDDLPGPETRVIQWASNSIIKTLVDLPFSHMLAVGPSCIDGTCTVYGVSDLSSSLCRLRLHMAQGLPTAERPICLSGLQVEAVELSFSPARSFLAVRSCKNAAYVWPLREVSQPLLVQHEADVDTRFICWARDDVILVANETSIHVFHCFEDHVMLLGTVLPDVQGISAICATSSNVVSFVFVLDAAGLSLIGYSLSTAVDPVTCTCEERVPWTRTFSASITAMQLFSRGNAPDSSAVLSLLLGDADGCVHVASVDCANRTVELHQRIVLPSGPVVSLCGWSHLRFCTNTASDIFVFERESTCLDFVEEFALHNLTKIVGISPLLRSTMGVCTRDGIRLWRPAMDNADSKSVWTASSVTLQTPAEISCFASSGNCVAVGAGRRTIVTSIPEDLDRSCVLPDHDPFSLLHFLRQGKVQTVERIFGHVMSLPSVEAVLEEEDDSPPVGIDDDEEARLKAALALNRFKGFERALVEIQGLPLSVILSEDDQAGGPEQGKLWRLLGDILRQASENELAARLYIMMSTCTLLRGVHTAVDQCGKNFLGPAMCSIASRKAFEAKDKLGTPSKSTYTLSSADVAWAYFSDSQEALIETCLSADCDWNAARGLGLGLWPRSNYTLKSVIEKCAKNQFLREKNPSDSLLLYLALGKKNAVLGLYKAVKDTKLASFLQNDFEEERWRTAALRNAYVLMGQHKFEMAAAFFLLGGQPDDATNVCLKQMRDLNLAVVISRLVGGDASDLHKKVLQQDVIPMTQELNDPILRCMAHWSLGEFSQAADCLHIKHADAFSDTRPLSARIWAYLMTKPALRSAREESRHASAEDEMIMASLQAVTGYQMLGLPALALASILESPLLRSPASAHVAKRIASSVLGKAHLTPASALHNLSSQLLPLAADIDFLASWGLHSFSSELAMSIPPFFLAPQVVFTVCLAPSGWESAIEAVRHALRELCGVSFGAISARASDISVESLKSYWSNAYDALANLDARGNNGWQSSRPTQSDAVVAAVSLCLGTFAIAWITGDASLFTTALHGWLHHQPSRAIHWLGLLPPSIKSVFEKGKLSNQTKARSLDAPEPFVVTLLKCLLAHKFVASMRQHIIRCSGRGQNEFLLDILSKIQLQSQNLADRLSRIFPKDPKMCLLALPRVHSTFRFSEATPVHRSLSAQQLSEKARGMSSTAAADDLFIGRESSHATEEDSAERKAASRSAIATICCSLPSVEDAWIRLTNDVECRHLVVRSRQYLQSIIRKYLPLPSSVPLFEDKPAILLDGSDVIRGLAVDMRGEYVAASTLRSVQEVNLRQSWLHRPSIDRSSFDRPSIDGPSMANAGTPPRRVPRQNSIFQPIRPQLVRSDAREPQNDLLKDGVRNGVAVHVIAGHPSLPMYLAVDDGEVVLFAFGHTTLSRAIRLLPSSVRATAGKWSPCGAHFGVTSSSGGVVVAPLGIFAASHSSGMPQHLVCHSKRADDLVFLNAGSALATAGTSSDNKNVCIWDLMLPGSSGCAESLVAHSGGATCITYSSTTSSLISGGRSREIVLWDPRMEASTTMSESAHTGAVQAVAAFPTFDYIVASGGADGSVKLWDLRTRNVVQSWEKAHIPHSVITKASQDPESRGVTSVGVSSISFLPGALVTAGGDGVVNFYRLL